jgi:hypothetical protein
MRKIITKFFKISGSKADQNQFNESKEILRHSLTLWRKFFSDLGDDRNLARLERIARGQIKRLLEIQAGGER